MKTCPRCQTEKPDEEFSPDPVTGKLRRAYCRPCFRDYERERRQADPEEARERQRRWRQRNWDAAKRAQYEWRERNPEAWKANQRRWREKYLNGYMRDKRQRNRDLVFAHYGEQCACCGERERLFLTIDHINNDGAEHRRSLGGQMGTEAAASSTGSSGKASPKASRPSAGTVTGQARQRRRVSASRYTGGQPFVNLRPQAMRLASAL